MIEMIEKGSQLRTLMRKPNAFPIPKAPGWYRWWFPEDIATGLLTPLSNVKSDSILRRDIEGVRYFNLYFGISKDLNVRIRWHLTQRHSASAVRSGYLSTLRQTLSALLGMDMSQGQNAVDLMLDKCFCEWMPVETHAEARNEELSVLSTEYHPLNLADNKVVDKSITDKIKQLRKNFRK